MDLKSHWYGLEARQTTMDIFLPPNGKQKVKII